VEPLASELLKASIKLDAHLVVLLVASVSKAENRKVHACKRFGSLIFLQHLEPFVEDSRVVTRVTFVMSGNDSQNKWLLGKLVFLKA